MMNYNMSLLILHDECVKFSRVCAKKKIISSLESKSNVMQVKLDKIKTISSCNKCMSPEVNIIELNQVIYKYEKDQLGLEIVLINQIYTNDKSQLGYSKFYKPSSSKKTIFVRSSDAYNNVQPKNVQNNFQSRMTYVRNTLYTSKTN